MFTQKIGVEYIDGRKAKINVLPVTHVAFEREFSMSFVAAFSEPTTLRMEHMLWLAWHAARTGTSFDDWLGTVAGLDMDVESTPVDPTNATPTDGT